MLLSIVSILLLLISQLAWSAEAATPIAYLAYTEGYWQAWVMAPDGSAQRQVTHSPYDKNRVSWYPDGSALLVNGNQGELKRVELDTGRETPIPAPLKGMQDAVLSPDGKQIAFSLSTSDSVDDNNIWLIDVNGGNQQKMTNMQGLQHEPAWSPDGRYLYFLSGKGGQVHDIWRLTIATRATEQLTSSSLYHFDVAVAPAGKLAFSSNQSGNYEIWLRDEQGRSMQMTDNPANDAKPAWSPDWHTLVFQSSRSGHPDIWRIGLNGGKPVQLTHCATGCRAPAWQHGMSGEGP